MKYGHVEAQLRAANPRTWRDDLAEALYKMPDVVIVIGAGVVTFTAGAVLLWWLLRGGRR